MDINTETVTILRKKIATLHFSIIPTLYINVTNVIISTPATSSNSDNEWTDSINAKPHTQRWKQQEEKAIQNKLCYIHVIFFSHSLFGYFQSKKREREQLNRWLCVQQISVFVASSNNNLTWICAQVGEKNVHRT